MKPIEVRSPFIKTRNVDNFDVMMDGLALAEGEKRFGLVYGEAGRGKSRTAQRWYANNANSIYIHTRKIWESSYLGFLRQMCKELDIKPIPRFKDICFDLITDALLQRPRVVLIDEIERLPPGFLEVTRDLTNITGCPIVLIGEDELVSYMRRNRRVWSCTFQQVEFRPIGAGDTMIYVREACGLNLPPEAAATTHRLSEGNFRDIRRIVLNLVQICNAKKTTEVGVEMVEIAYKTGLSSR